MHQSNQLKFFLTIKKKKKERQKKEEETPLTAVEDSTNSGWLISPTGADELGEKRLQWNGNGEPGLPPGCARSLPRRRGSLTPSASQLPELLAPATRVLQTFRHDTMVGACATNLLTPRESREPNRPILTFVSFQIELWSVCCSPF